MNGELPSQIDEDVEGLPNNGSVKIVDGAIVKNLALANALDKLGEGAAVTASATVNVDGNGDNLYFENYGSEFVVKTKNSSSADLVSSADITDLFRDYKYIRNFGTYVDTTANSSKVYIDNYRKKAMIQTGDLADTVCNYNDKASINAGDGDDFIRLGYQIEGLGKPLEEALIKS